MIALFLATLPSVAADGPFDAHGFDVGVLDGDPRDGLESPRAGRFEMAQWYAGGLLEFAKSPLVFEPTDGSEVQPALDNLFALDTSFGVGVHGNVRLQGSIPLYLTSTSLDGGQGVGIGDARLGAMIEAVRPDEDDLGFGLGFQPWLSLPTGTSGFLGEKGVSGGGSVVGGYSLEKFSFSGDVGVEFRKGMELSNLNGSDRLGFGLQLAYLVQEDLGIAAELRVHSPFVPSSIAPGSQAPAEIHLSARKRLESGGFFLGGISIPASGGAGTAAFRVFAGAGFGKPVEYVHDTDLDGLMDDVDACPTVAETVNQWKDTDGCPDTLSTVTVTVKNGADLVNDAKVVITPPAGVAVPTGKEFQAMPETTWSASATEGTCMAGTGTVTTVEGPNMLSVPLAPVMDTPVNLEIVDAAGKPVDGSATWEKAKDVCIPAGVLTTTAGKGTVKVGAGPHRWIVTAPSYTTVTTDVTVVAGVTQTVRVVLAPTKVKVTAQKIEILDKVFFETGKDIIKPESYGLLDEVAATIIAHPEITRLEVAGHTDSDGTDAANLDLSQRRAQSVVKYMIGKGVEPGRLVAQGYGESKPLVPNTSKANKANNRRVEFVILQNTPQP
jgi:outer membrane protein OmpA-like peptidoglycan-associated protein